MLALCVLRDFVMNRMVQEIKSLDSDMQMLVYENYNKFIAATDTIRKMRENVAGMEQEMGRLQKNMDSIGKCSEKIAASKLSAQRAKVEKLLSLERLITKLNFLFELPLRLRQCVELAAHAQARTRIRIAYAASQARRCKCLGVSVSDDS